MKRCDYSAAVRMGRANARLTLDDLSTLSGINRATIHRIEQGGSPAAETLEAIAAGLGMELVDLLELGYVGRGGA